MKKSNLMKLVCLAITASIVFSCGGQLLADELTGTRVPEDVFTQEEQDEAAGQADPEDIFGQGDQEDIFVQDDSDVAVYDQEEVFYTDEADAEAEDGDGLVFTHEGTIDLSTLDFDYDEYELAAGYINEKMDLGRQSYDQSYNYRKNLSKYNLAAYDYIRKYCSQVASGNKSSTFIVIPESVLKIEFTASDLGLSTLKNVSDSKLDDAIYSALIKHDYNPDTIIDVLLFSCPYELYWMDKTNYISYNWQFELNSSTNPTKVTVSKFNFRFPVEKEYQKNGNTYLFDTSYGTAVNASVNNAKKIINSCSNMDDYNKLLTYANKICALTDYNHKAVETENPVYGNPWQMIWVFDGDPSTKVVCEGYSKAFQFLCDNTTFNSNKIYAICAYGDCEGAHMWNVVHMDDDKSYLVDTTFRDGGFDLFLKGGSAYRSYGFIVYEDGYYLPYVYDDYMYDYYPSSVLKLASTDYVYNSNPTPAPTYKNQWVQSGSNWYYYDANGVKVTGWQKIGSAWYYFNSNGVMQTGWKQIGGSWYFFRSSGSMVSNDWQKSGSSWYYLGSSGAMVTNGWLKIGGYWYYFNSDGRMQTGWLKIRGTWYFLGTDGAMKVGWVKSGNKWYYLNSSGAMVTGWQKIGGNTYYFNAAGDMVTGTVSIDGKRYKFDQNGHLIS